MKIWTFDTEDDSKGNVKIINFFDGKEHFTFHHSEIKKQCSKREKTRLLQKRALEFLSELKDPSHTFWAVNLQYDLNNLFGLHLYLPKINYVGSRTISASILGTGIRFHDTMNHWKIGVEEMGKKIGLLKIKTTDFDNIEYCRRDSEIAFRFIEKMQGAYEKIGCQLKATIGSTALNFFEKHYFQKQRKRILNKTELRFLHTGYYGGRTEIFHTEPVTGRIFYFDFNSLYPAVSRGLFPILRRDAINWTKHPDFYNSEGAAEITIQAPEKMDIPYLPSRSENGALIFPLGTFRGCYTYFEIREALKIGYKIERIHKALEFSAGVFRPFKTYMEDLFRKRLEVRAEGDDISADGYKLLMNNLYGKWGQGNEHEELIPHGGRPKAGQLILGHLVLEKIEGEYPLHSNKIWAMYTTAYGRHELWKAMIKVKKKGGLMIACDTDSVIFENRSQIFEEKDGLGELKLERPKDSKNKFWRYAHFKLPKLYRLDGQYKAKGIPRKGESQKEYFETGRTKFRKPLKLREVLRRNLSPKRKKKLIPNFWIEVEKESNKVYDKRLILTGGFTAPLKINRRRPWKRQLKLQEPNLDEFNSQEEPELDSLS